MSESCTYQDICTFCDEAAGRASTFTDLGLSESARDYVLYESSHFVVVPCVGPLTDWYVLVVPKRHVLSSGWLDADERAELEAVVQEISRRVKKVSGQRVVLFEHGSYSFRDKGGACHDHAHIHIVATENRLEDFLAIVAEHVELSPCENWIDAAVEYIASGSRSYLVLSHEGTSYIGPAEKSRSQFFRRSLACWLGVHEGEVDWLVFPHVDRLRAMLSVGLPE